MPPTYVLYLIVMFGFIVYVKTTSSDEKCNNLANKMRILSRKSVKLQQNNEKAYYKSHIKEWKETPFYKFVLDTIKKVAKNGENGVIINYYFGKSNLPPIKPHYAEAVTSSGHKVLYACHSYYFSKEEENSLSDYATRESYLYGIETYLKDEGFYIKSGNNNYSFSVSW